MPRHDLHQFDLRPAVAAAFVQSLQLEAGSEIYEIGPGTGALTAALLGAGARVYAVEVDAERVTALHRRFADAVDSGQLQLLCGDAHLLMPLFAPGWRIVANPPFQHTASLLRQCLLEDLPAGPPQRFDLVLQQEAAEKWCGMEHAHTRSSILARLWGSPVISAHLERSDVKPQSHVDLCTFSLEAHQQRISPVDLRCVDSLLAIAFAGAHSVRDALRSVTTPAILKKQSKMHKWNADEHPRTLSPAAWFELATFLRSIHKI